MTACATKGCTHIPCPTNQFCDDCMELHALQKSEDQEWNRRQNDLLQREVLSTFASGGKAPTTDNRCIKRPKLSTAEKQKHKTKQRAEKIKEAKSAARNERAAEEVYFAMSDSDDEDSSFDTVWAHFSQNHVSKQLSTDVQKAGRAVQQKKHIELMDQPACNDETGIRAWLDIPALPCPVCGAGLRRLLRQQGAGGWHSILTHVSKCRTKIKQDITAGRVSKDDAVAMATDISVAAAWRQAKEVMIAAEKRKTTAREKHLKEKEKQTRLKCAATVPHELQCQICDKTFRASDKQSFERHYETCKTKQARRKELHRCAVEDTQRKVYEAKCKVTKTEMELEQARRNLKAAKINGQEMAERQKEQRKREAKMKKSKGIKSYVQQDSKEEKAEAKVAGVRAVEKAQKLVKKAEEALTKSQEVAREREAVACAVKERADVEAENAKHGYSHKMILSPKKRNKQTPQLSKQAQKKESKEVKAAKAKTKTAAKKDRRGTRTAEETWHESCGTEWASSKAGKASMAMYED